jgi:peptidyl-prolyl cis-trans isomerase C
MKKNHILNTLLVLLLSTGFVAHANKIGIAATVQGKDISEARLQNSIDSYLQQQGTNIGAIRDPKRIKVVREQILDKLIGQELLWQAAYKSKLIASDEEISQAYKQYQAQFDDEVSFNIKIQEGGFNKASFQEYLKRQLSAQKWIEEFVAKDVIVDESEIHAFYLENQHRFIQPEKIRARHILIQVKPQASNAEKEIASSLLADIKQEIDSGASFETLAREKSQDSSAAAGGDLGYFERGQMVKPFEKAAFSLAPGEVSEIIETRFGFHLIQLVDRTPPVQYEEKDLVEKIQPYLWQQKYQRAIQDAVTVLKEGALIEKSTL